MKIVFELPYYSPCVGGIVESVKFAQKLGAHIRFQRRSTFQIPKDITYTIGLPYNSFPRCDIAVSYSDNPFMDRLVRLPQIGRKMVYMLSYGMNYHVERHNALNHRLTTLCSTKKIEDAITKDGGEVHRIGFALDMEDMQDDGTERKDLLAIYYHPHENKRYRLAIDVAIRLHGMNFINNIISFGSADGWRNNNPFPVMNKHYRNANRKEVKNIFNQSKVFIMPSISEGLNLTPIEATLCGCPAVICDGAIGELFIDGETCFVANPDDNFDILNNSIELISNVDECRPLFRDNMRKLINNYTWDKLITNFNKLL